MRSDEDPSSRLQPVTDARRLRITFNGSVSDVLPWKFTPQQREVRVLPGETALAVYTATNKSDDDIIGVATYSVTPGQVAPYFSKIQCFCFEGTLIVIFLAAETDRKKSRDSMRERRWTCPCSSSSTLTSSRILR